ncbi:MULTISPECIES: TonB-dependent receptor domain-containing protein [unclassified Simplicispira]|uniref:TonB-dependent receptor domain-containing protein n=1 Tax=unclassified Simplicispira TaxID=2630407 RepID=UPI000D5C8339|nr:MULTISPECIES: TonB-dependent receptor [unclassified Simplicispira]PVY55161.1 vitamin B12 transporter [Simplicispira sp. 125]REG16104.1 vitamin B12 transporter [Simplicispira sp. 110]
MKNHLPHVRPIASLRPVVLATLSLFAAHAAHAQEVAAPILLAQNLRAPQLSETVVTATRTEQALSDLVADVSIVDRETIESSGATGVADLLARLPGVEITRNGGVGNASSVYVRGAEQRFTAVYIDGVRIDSQSTGGAVWEQIPLSQIERIEVLRGPAAAVYGSDAIGGVIQLFTRKGEGPAAPYVGIGLGNQGTRKVEAGVSGATGPEGALDYALGLAHARSSGFDSKSSGAHNPDDDGYRSTSATARLGYRVNAQHRIGANLLVSRLNSGYDGFTYKPTAPDDDRNLNRLHTAGAHWAAQWSDSYSTRVSVNESLSRYETTPSPYLTQTQLRGYLWQNDWRLGAHRLSAALERREDQLENASLVGGTTRSRSQDALALGYGFSAGAHSVQANLRHDSDSEFGGKGTGSLAYGYAFAPGWRATASAGTAFRAPTLYQRFSQYGDASLQPETSRNAELGLRYGQGTSAFSAVVYRNRVANLINFAAGGTCGEPFGCYLNTGNAEYSGVTLAGSYQLAGVQLRGSVDFQNPHDRDTGKQLARRAKRHATLGADTVLSGWTLGAEMQASGRRFDNAANTKVLGGYTLFNLYASTRLARDYTLLARIDNAADKNYETAGTYATGGRQLYIGLKWEPL